MSSVLRKVMIFVGAAPLLLTGIGAGAAHAAAGRAGPYQPGKKAPKPVGYVFASTFESVIDRLAIEPDHTLKLVGTVPTPDADTFGLALLHTPGGVHLYAMVRTGPVADMAIVQYSVNVATGALTLDKVPAVTGVAGGFPGNNLVAYDGYGDNGSGASVLFTGAGCVTSACLEGGLAEYRANPSSGKLSLVSPVAAADVRGVSISGADLDVLFVGAKNQGFLRAAEVNRKTGGLKASGSPFGLTGLVVGSLAPINADVVATGPGRVGVGDETTTPAGVGVFPSTGLHIGPGQGVEQADEVSTMGFISHALVAGEIGPTNGPQLELFNPNGGGSEGTVDLTKKPYGLNPGSQEDPNFPEQIFTLGKGVYTGMYAGPILQATDGVGGKGFAINKTRPTVAGTFSASSMTGYLFPPKTKTTLTVQAKGGKVHVQGSVTGGKAGLPVSVVLSRKSGKLFHSVHSAKTKLSKKRKYATSLPRAKGGECRVTVRYKGDAKSGPSHAAKTFAC